MRRSRLQGPILAGLIGAAWLACLVWDLHFHRWTVAGSLAAPVLIALQCWLNVGLFIVAHDCMHGSLAPGHPLVNKVVGRACLVAYAGFSFDRMRPKHMLHHAHPGTGQDPDFSADHPTRFWPWFMRFFRTYFGWIEFAGLVAVVGVCELALRASPVDLLVFWAVPALLSAAQLFYFGTFLPHRHRPGGFADRFNARSNEYRWLWSLLTCFHFGYHHEHHLHPAVPWWRLPAVRGRAG